MPGPQKGEKGACSLPLASQETAERNSQKKKCSKKNRCFEKTEGSPKKKKTQNGDTRRGGFVGVPPSGGQKVVLQKRNKAPVKKKDFLKTIWWDQREGKDNAAQ